MQLPGRASTFGIVGVIATVTWLANWAGEAGGEPATGTARWYTGETLAAIALLATAVLFAGLAVIRAAGHGRIARTILWAVPVGFTFIFIGALANLATAAATENGDMGAIGLVFPIGGTLCGFAGLAAGVLIAVRGVLTGWGRWAPLAFAVVYNTHAILSDGANSTLSATLELAQHLLIGAVAVALLTTRPRHQAPVPVAARSVS
jgi:ABC-type multidrug transport system permease subunit